VRKSNRRGFTLIEMMIIVLIVAILALIVGLAVRNASDRAKHTRYVTDTSAITYAAVKYHNDTGKWPTSVDDVIAADTDTADNHKKPSLGRTKTPLCPWCQATYVIEDDDTSDHAGEAYCENHVVDADRTDALWSKHTAP
jgi:general secretion pathway protein G